MQNADIDSLFVDIVVDSLSIDASKVTADATLDGLGAESLDIVEISMEAESKFNVWLPDKSILDTAIDVVGRSALLEGQLLSDYGKDLLRARLPRDQWALLEGDVAASGLQSYFMRVDTWVGMITELREHTPRSCAECDGAELADRPGFVLVCDSCGHEMQLRSGEEINRGWVEEFVAKNPPRTPENRAIAAVAGGSPVAG